MYRKSIVSVIVASAFLAFAAGDMASARDGGSREDKGIAKGEPNGGGWGNPRPRPRPGCGPAALCLDPKPRPQPLPRPLPRPCPPNARCAAPSN